MKGFENIFYAYYVAKKDNLYYNEIKELSSLSDSSLSRGLKELVKTNIINKKETKSNTYYKIKDKKRFTLEFSKFAFNQFENLNTGIKMPLKNFLKGISNNVYTIVLFGSSSRKEEQEGSDIDLLIISEKEVNLDKLKEDVNITSNYPISIFYSNIEEFEKTKDHVIIQAKKTGFPIFKEQNFYEVMINEY